MSSPKNSEPLVLAVDQGTSSTKAVIVDGTGSVVARASVPLGQTHPAPGWVEQDPDELLATVERAISLACDGVAGTIVALGISSQRESAIAWNRATGERLGPLLGWQDRRTAPEARRLHAEGFDAHVRAATGLPIDPMFSALKFAWLLDVVDPDRRRSRAGEIAVGTVDSWIVFCLTGEHRIEVGNASRTLLLSVDTGDWDDSLLEIFNVPRAVLPRVVSSAEHTGAVTGIAALPPGVPVTAVLADSHAALYGHGVREPGAVKVTYGTGSSIMGLLAPGASAGQGLVRTIAWSLGTPVHAFEGNILSAGSTVKWMAQILSTTPEKLSALAASVADSDGAHLVPAFAGLGAPWWDDTARGLLSGLTLGTSKEHLARAAFESIVFQVEDVLEAADAGNDTRIRRILADGGPSANRWLMQNQADISQREVLPSSVSELSALGVADLAGSSAGLWGDGEAADSSRSTEALLPKLAPGVAFDRRTAWLGAVARARGERTRALEPGPAPQRSVHPRAGRNENP